MTVLLYIICSISWLVIYIYSDARWDVVASLSLAGCVSLDSAPNLHTRPKSQSARKAIGLTAHVIEPAKPRRPRALAGEAVVESGGGLAG